MYMSVHEGTYLCIYIFVCLYVCMYVCIHVCMYVCYKCDINLLSCVSKKKEMAVTNKETKEVTYQKYTVVKDECNRCCV